MFIGDSQRKVKDSLSCSYNWLAMIQVKVTLDFHCRGVTLDFHCRGVTLDFHCGGEANNFHCGGSNRCFRMLRLQCCTAARRSRFVPLLIRVRLSSLARLPRSSQITFFVTADSDCPASPFFANSALRPAPVPFPPGMNKI